METQFTGFSKLFIKCFSKLFIQCFSKLFIQCFSKLFIQCFSQLFIRCFSKLFIQCFSQLFIQCFSKLFIQCFFMRVMLSKSYSYSCFGFSLQKTPFSRSSLPVPATLGQIQNATAEEGRNETKECNVTVGTPLNVSWKNVKTGQFTKGKLLTIINVRRNQSGEYRCIANNTCGNESTGMFIDMHCKNLFKVFTRLSDVYYSILASVFYNCVLNHIAVISMLLSSQS